MTLLIKNIQLIDGTGRPAVKANILVKKEKIYAIGSFPNYKADEIIDGMGAYLAPGFIDLNVNSDRNLTLFSNPSQEDFLLQGVTTIIGGQRGISLAPLLYGSLESIKPWANPNSVNIDWQTVDEFLKTMAQRSWGVNFGTLVGHYTVRESLIGNNFRKLTKNEIIVFKFLLEHSFKNGAFGFSTDLRRYQFQQFSYKEIKSLIEAVAKFNGIYTVYLQDEREGLLDSVKEIINIAKKTGVKILINHLQPTNGFQKNYEAALELINKNTTKADVYFNLYFADSVEIPISNLLPSWIQDNNKEIMLNNLQAPKIRKKIIEQMPKLNGRKIIITSAPDNKYLIGKSLEEFSANRNLDVKNGLLALMEVTIFQVIIFYGNTDIKAIYKAAANNRSVISSNFTKFLELSEKEKILSIEKAINKITGLPAQLLGLRNRGVIKDGNFADLVIFRDGKIKDVILNGKIVVRNGKYQNILTGKILRKI